MDDIEFRKLITGEVIPHLNHMISKEECHLAFLKENKAPDGYIGTSEYFLKLYKLRLRQYENYLKGVSLDT